MLRLSYSARGDDASRDGHGHGLGHGLGTIRYGDAMVSRDAIPPRDAIPSRGGDAWLEDGRFPEDAVASRRGVGADVVHPPVVGSIPADAFDPALQHMVSLEQRRAWEEMRRRRATMDDAHATWIARARADAATRGHPPPVSFTRALRLRASGSNSRAKRRDRGPHPRRRVTPDLTLDEFLLRPRLALPAPPLARRLRI